jgi:hypothetical protein
MNEFCNNDRFIRKCMRCGSQRLRALNLTRVECLNCDAYDFVPKEEPRVGCQFIATDGAVCNAAAADARHWPAPNATCTFAPDWYSHPYTARSIAA